MADDTQYTGNSYQVSETKQTIQGTPQAQPTEPDDGKTLIHEVFVQTDRVITDPNDPLAVQIPEGVGASTVGQSPALSALTAGTPEQQFAKADGREIENDSPDAQVSPGTYETATQVVADPAADSEPTDAATEADQPAADADGATGSTATAS